MSFYLRYLGIRDIDILGKYFFYFVFPCYLCNLSSHFVVMDAT